MLKFFTLIRNKPLTNPSTAVWHWQWLKHALAMLVLLGLALFFRLYGGLENIPPAFHGDEATLALEAQRILNGDFYLFSEREGSDGVLWNYLLALAFALFGESIVTVRGLAATAGSLGVALSYAAVYQLLKPWRGDTEAMLIGLLTGVYLASSIWMISVSRMGYGAILGLPIHLLAVWFIWYSLNQKSWWLGIIAGVLIGLHVYLYVSFRIFPLVLALFFLIDAALRWRTGAYLRQQFKTVLTMALVSASLYAPLLYIYSTQGVGARTGQYTIFSPIMNQGDFWGWTFRSVQVNLAAFFPLPDVYNFHVPSLSLGLMTQLGFVIGLLLLLRHLKRPENLFLLVWWAVLLLPSIIAMETALHLWRRTIPLAPVTFALVSLGLVGPVFWLKNHRPRWQYAGLAIAGVAVAVSLGGLVQKTYADYYLFNLNDERAAIINHIYDFELAAVMQAEGTAQTRYILPLDSSSGAVSPQSDTLAFIYGGQAEYTYIWDDDRQVFTETEAFIAGAEQVGVMTWKTTKHTQADPRHLFDYSLEQWGDYSHTSEHQYFKIDYYHAEIPAPPTAITLEKSVNFETVFRLNRAAFQAQPIAGDYAWVELTWEKIGPSESDFYTSLRLETAEGQPISQLDKPLLNNLWHRKTSAWELGTTQTVYYLLPLPATTLPGEYSLKVIFYTAPSENSPAQAIAPQQENLAPDLSLALGQLEVQLTDQPAALSKLPLAHSLNHASALGLTLLGVGPLPPEKRTGEQFSLALWWQATQALAPNLRWQIYLEGETERYPLHSPQKLGSDRLPSQNWPLTTPLQTFAMLDLPAELTSGLYQLTLYLEPDTRAEAISLGQVQVNHRPRVFTLPQPQTALTVNFGNQINLLGYDFQADEAALTVYWQAQSDLEANYKVFLHLLNGDNEIIGQVDREPNGGTTPTGSWLAEEVIADSLTLPSENLAQVETVVIGLYDAQTGQRLQLLGQASHPASPNGLSLLQGVPLE